LVFLCTDPRIGRPLFAIVLRLIFRSRIVARERIPLEDSLLAVCNRISFADLPLLGTVMPRPVAFMTMAEMFRKPWMALPLRAVGCLPVDRSRADSRRRAAGPNVSQSPPFRREIASALG
jgi:1-acyl-sn-glycerol-3-phosphate acyltransferase